MRDLVRLHKHAEELSTQIAVLRMRREFPEEKKNRKAIDRQIKKLTADLEQVRYQVILAEGKP